MGIVDIYQRSHEMVGSKTDRSRQKKQIDCGLSCVSAGGGARGAGGGRDAGHARRDAEDAGVFGNGGAREGEGGE
jgi:hypothetical protein